jgi:FtsH-binding integral membrane protein
MPWISLAVSALSLFNALGALHVLAALPTLRQLPVAMPLALLLGMPLAWSLIFAALGLGLWLQKQRAIRLFAPLLSFYALSRLGLALLAQSDYDRSRFGAQATLTALWLGAIWLYAQRRHLAKGDERQCS